MQIKLIDSIYTFNISFNQCKNVEELTCNRRTEDIDSELEEKVDCYM